MWLSLSSANNALLTCYGLLTEINYIYTNHNTHIQSSTAISLTWPSLFCSFTVFLLTFSTDDSDFLTIVTCCLCALIIVSALLVYGSFKVIFWPIFKKALIFTSLPLSEYKTLRGVVDFCRCNHCRRSIDGALRCHSCREYEE